jgi:hypothetical protein
MARRAAWTASDGLAAVMCARKSRTTRPSPTCTSYVAMRTSVRRNGPAHKGFAELLR